MESNNRNDMPAFMDTDLDPYTLVHDIVSNWWVIILGAIAGALLTYVVVSSRYVPPQERSPASILISNCCKGFPEAILTFPYRLQPFFMENLSYRKGFLDLFL